LLHYTRKNAAALHFFQVEFLNIKAPQMGGPVSINSARINYFFAGCAGAGGGAGVSGAGAGGGVIAGCAAGWGASFFFSQPINATAATHMNAARISTIIFFMYFHLLST
jgi:hypothetical protein